MVWLWLVLVLVAPVGDGCGWHETRWDPCIRDNAWTCLPPEIQLRWTCSRFAFQRRRYRGRRGGWCFLHGLRHGQSIGFFSVFTLKLGWRSYHSGERHITFFVNRRTGIRWIINHSDTLSECEWFEINHSSTLSECNWSRINYLSTFFEFGWLRINHSSTLFECKWFDTNYFSTLSAYNWFVINHSDTLSECEWFDINHSSTLSECNWSRINCSGTLDECKWFKIKHPYLLVSSYYKLQSP